jgi:hypothetical protein
LDSILSIPDEVSITFNERPELEAGEASAIKVTDFNKSRIDTTMIMTWEVLKKKEL